MTANLHSLVTYKPIDSTGLRYEYDSDDGFIHVYLNDKLIKYIDTKKHRPILGLATMERLHEEAIG